MYCAVLITAKNIREARKISKKLLESRLIACANIVKDLESHFVWEGKSVRASEVLMIVKTQKKYFQRIVKIATSLHSYEVPEIIALPIQNGYNPYLKWIDQSTQQGKTK